MNLIPLAALAIATLAFITALTAIILVERIRRRHTRTLDKVRAARDEAISIAEGFRDLNAAAAAQTGPFITVGTITKGTLHLETELDRAEQIARESMKMGRHL